MSRFKQVIKKKELETALSKHPLREIDEQTKKDYIKGLVFLATADENFHEDEKSYIVSLMKNIGLEENLLGEFEKFASDCSEEELLSFIDRLKTFQEDIKINFMIEVVIVCFKDGEFDESEQSIFDDYLEMLEIQDKKDDIMYIALALINKDIDLALAYYTVKKEVFLKYDYMFDILDIDIEKELKELYHWEWVEFRLEVGQIENDNLVASKPVTVRQVCVYFNSQFISNNLYQVPNTTRFEGANNQVVIDSIDKTNLEFENNLFQYSADMKNHDFIGTTEKTPLSFSNWVNDNDLTFKVGGLKIIAGANNNTSFVGREFFGLNKDTIVLSESAKGFLTNNYEQFIAYIGYQDQGDKVRFIDVSNTDYCYHNDVERCGLKSDISYAFRLMNISGSEG